MFSFYVTVLLGAASYCTGSPIGCSEDAHCLSGFYCQPGRFLCSQCINCTHMKRLPPPLVENECITKVTDCGSCYKGLVDNLTGEDCVAPSPRSVLGTLPAYAWAVMALGMLVLGLVVCLTAAYVMRNFNTFKVLACYTRTSVQSDTIPRDDVAGDGAPPSYDSIAGAPVDAGALEESRPFIQPMETPITTQQVGGRIPNRGQTDSNLITGQIDSNLISGQIPGRGQIDSNLITGQIPSRGQTDSHLNSSPTAVYPELTFRRLSNKDETM